MSDIVKLMYDTPWLSYSKVLIGVKDRWFNKWMRRSATNKVNRASAKGGSLHCGGSATIPSTQERMAKELNREPTIAE
ncbi:hypothetical protein PIB30_111970, partial [Stylosanthes scabra]|nr:hypothetical protein [Stylosanthes scabra]